MNDGTQRDQSRQRGHRLLPWSGEDGRPCYLSSDGDGFIDALADHMEETQLGLGSDLLLHVRELLTVGEASGESSAGEQELRFLVQRLAEALRDALRVAESRGERLARHEPERVADRRAWFTPSP